MATLVKEIMTKNPDALSDDMTLEQAAAEMQKYDFGFIPIKHENKVIGVVTDRDLVVRCIAKGEDPKQTTLKDIMTEEVLFCHDDDDLSKAIKMMSDNQIHRLAVYDKQNNLCGVISMGDIARKNKDASLLGKLTEAIRQP